MIIIITIIIIIIIIIIALTQKWKFETGNRKLVVSSTGASGKDQLG